MFAPNRIDMSSWRGIIRVSSTVLAGHRWRWKATPTEEWSRVRERAVGLGLKVLPEPGPLYFRRGPANHWRVRVPHWVCAAFVGTLATLPFLRPRFSLRTLLIGMTVVAVGLGAAVMMLRGS